MSSKETYPVTPATRFLKDHKIAFLPFQYEYVEKGGTKQTAQELNVPENQIVKSLVFIDGNRNVFMVLMNGDFEVSTKELARQINVKSISICDANTAMKYTGYQFGGTSPFGTKRELNIYIEKSILNYEDIYINGGKRGFIIQIKSEVLLNKLKSKTVEVAINK